MKKYTFLPMLGALGTILLSACGGGKSDDKTARPLELESYTYDAICEVAESDSIDTSLVGGRYWRTIGQGVLPVSFGDDMDITLLRDSLENLANVEFDQNSTAHPRLSDDRKVTTLSPDSIEACSYASNNLAVRLITPYVAVWKNTLGYYNCGAAHGRTVTTYVNFSLSSRKILSLSDIITPGKENELLELLKERVKENPDVFTDADIQIPSNFCITSDGVLFTYGQYDIAPYSAGEITVSFDAYELDDILTPEAQRLILGKL